MKVSGLLAIAICVVVSMGMPAGATVLLDDNFSSYSTGNLSGQTAPNGQTWASLWGVNGAVVASGGNPGQAMGHTSTTDGQNWSQLSLGTTVTSASAENIINFSVEGKLGDFTSTTEDNCAFTIWGDSNKDWVDLNIQQVGTGSGAYTRVFLGRLSVDAAYLNGGAALINYGGVDDHAWIRVWGQIDLGLGKVTVGYDDGTESGSASYTDAAISTMSIDSLWLGPEVKPASLGDNGTYMDNLLVETVVPEPVTLALLAVGGLIAVIRRHRVG